MNGYARKYREVLLFLKTINYRFCILPQLIRSRIRLLSELIFAKRLCRASAVAVNNHEFVMSMSIVGLKYGRLMEM